MLGWLSINLGPQPWRISNHRWLKCIFVCFCFGIQNDRKLRKKWQKGCFLIALFCLNQQRNSELSLKNSSFFHQWFRLQSELFVCRWGFFFKCQIIFDLERMKLNTFWNIQATRNHLMIFTQLVKKTLLISFSCNQNNSFFFLFLF